MTVLMFLMSKDDSLLLLTGGLIYSILGAKDFVSQQAKEEVKELFGEYEGDEESKEDEAMLMNPMLAMSTPDGILSSFLEVLNTDMPLRNFTNRLFARLLFWRRPDLDATTHSTSNNETKEVKEIKENKTTQLT